MNIWKSILLGLIQGVTEFLPVSSSGHLVLTKHLLSVQEVPLLFDVMLHVATLAVVVFFFRYRILRILGAFIAVVRGRRDEQVDYHLRLAGVILLGSVFTAVLGLLFRGTAVFHETNMVSVLFLVTGVLLISTAFASAAADQRPRAKHAVWVGIAQGLGTLPGISRSGITITAALWAGIDREKAGELSFLLSVPAITGALILELGNAGALQAQMAWTAVAAGCAAAVLAGGLSLKLLLWLVQKGRLYVFSFYLIPLGIAGLLFL
ncbi:MAG: undecaprenyl-diphosphate phosphatase [Spirochaetota bacterium]